MKITENLKKIFYGGSMQAKKNNFLGKIVELTMTNRGKTIIIKNKS